MSPLKKQLFDLEVKGQGPTKVIMVRVKACPDHNFFVFPDRSIIFGMWVHDHKAAYRNDLCETFDLKVK
jgi:hypothetical protein